MKADVTVTYTFSLSEQELTELELDQSEDAAPLADQIKDYVEENATDLIDEQQANMDVEVSVDGAKGAPKGKPKPEKTD